MDILLLEKGCAKIDNLRRCHTGNPTHHSSFGLHKYGVNKQVDSLSLTVNGCVSFNPILFISPAIPGKIGDVVIMTRLPRWGGKEGCLLYTSPSPRD